MVTNPRNPLGPYTQMATFLAVVAVATTAFVLLVLVVLVTSYASHDYGNDPTATPAPRLGPPASDRPTVGVPEPVQLGAFCNYKGATATSTTGMPVVCTDYALDRFWNYRWQALAQSN